jgi:serine-type D-Ala-D-Ala carboxypeptidase/endopeptidase
MAFSHFFIFVVRARNVVTDPLGMPSLKGGNLKAITARAFILCLLAGLSVTATLAANAPSNDHEGFQQIVASHDAAPSIVAFRITPDERLLASRPHDSGQVGIPATERLFEIGSITKLFTAMLLADLIEDGVVEEASRVGELMPGDYALAEQVADITLVELATHASGLPRLPTRGPMLRRMLLRMGDPYAGSTREEIFADIAALEAEQLGERGAEQYSNLGMALLGQLLAESVGTAYETLVEERLLRPLGMAETRFTRGALDDSRLQRPHRENGRPASNWRLDAYNPAGGLVSNMTDMARFLDAVIAGEHPAIAKSLQVARHDEDGQARMGLGWIISEMGGETVYWHNGRTGGYSSFLAWMPESGRALIMLSNASHPIDPMARALLLGEEEPPAENPGMVSMGFFLFLLILAPITLMGRRHELQQSVSGDAKRPKGWLNGLGSWMTAAFILGVAWLNGPWQALPPILLWLSGIICVVMAAWMLPVVRQLSALPEKGRLLNLAGFMLDSLLFLSLIWMLLYW